MAFAFAQKSKKPVPPQAKRGRVKKQIAALGHVEQGHSAGVVGFGQPVSAAGGAPVIQAKLKIGEPDDQYEKEADRVADAVMRMPDPMATGAPADAGVLGSGKQPVNGSLAIQRMCTDCALEEEDKLQRKPLADNTPTLPRISALNDPVAARFPLANNPSAIQRVEMGDEDYYDEMVQMKSAEGGAAVPTVTPGVEAGINSLKGGGQPLPASTRAFFEPRFGVDFSAVRVHSDGRATQVAQAVQARAFTTGHNIVFGAGEHSPVTSAGRKLLAHELTHVVQQQSLPSVIQRDATPTGITLKEAKSFGHANLKSDELKKKWRTYIGSTTLMQVTPAGNYKGHCVKEYLAEVANTCPTRFSELRKGAFCTESKCLDFDRWGTAGDPLTGNVVTDGSDTFIDRHRTRHPESLLEGTGKNECSVACHQRYKYDRRHDLGSFFVIRNFRAGQYTPPGSSAALHITTGDVKKVPASLEAPSKKKFAKDIAPGLKKRGVLIEAPRASQGSVRRMKLGKGTPPPWSNGSVLLQTVPQNEKPTVIKAINKIKKVVYDPDGFDDCHQFFAKNCKNGAQDSLRKTFNKAVLWKFPPSIPSSAGASGQTPGDHIAYTQRGYNEGVEALAGYLMHELLHNCGVGGPEHHLNDVARLYCMGAGKNRLSIFGGPAGEQQEAGYALLSYRRFLTEWASGRLKPSVGADFNIVGLASGELASVMTGVTGRTNILWGGERFGGLTVSPEIGLGIGRFRRLTENESSVVEWAGGFVFQLKAGAEFAFPDLSFREGRRTPISIEAAYRIVKPLNSKAENIHTFVAGISYSF